jgi:DNA-binding LytR/AlgR family response regulator
VHLTNGKKQIVSMQLGQIEKAIPSSHFFRINRSVIINLQYFSNANQKERKCYLKVNRQAYEFNMKVTKMKELLKVMMGE